MDAFRQINLSTKRIFLIAAMLTFGLTSCNTPAGHNEAEDIAAIKVLSASRAKAFNEGDAGIIAAAFTETGLLMAPGNKSMTGREAVRTYYQQIFDQYKTVLESGYDDVKVSGDMGYGVGFARVTLVPHSGGDTLVSTSKYINILERQADGSWLTTHDIWNSNE